MQVGRRGQAGGGRGRGQAAGGGRGQAGGGGGGVEDEHQGEEDPAVRARWQPWHTHHTQGH